MIRIIKLLPIFLLFWILGSSQFSYVQAQNPEQEDLIIHVDLEVKKVDKLHRNIEVASELHNQFSPSSVTQLYNKLVNEPTLDEIKWQQYIDQLKNHQLSTENQQVFAQSSSASENKNSDQKPLLKQSKEISLLNVYNFQYYGSIYLGTSAKKVSLLFDTAQDWLSVESAGCRTCAGSNYNIGSSANYKQATTRASYHFYGKSGWLGFNSTDDVYLDSTKTIGISDFLWFLIIDQQGISEESDGVLGLCRKYSSNIYQSGPSLVESLHKAGKISNYMVSMNLGNLDTQSFVQIGGYSTTYMRDPSKLIWIQSAPDFYWSVTVNGFKTTKEPKYSNQLLSIYTSSRFKGIIDSGQPLIYLPHSIGVEFISRILRGKVYAYYENLFMVSCDTSSFEPISILINGNWFEISPETYIVEVKESPQICALGFQINGDDAFILGNVFLRNYYTIFDYQNNRIGFSPQKSSEISDISLFKDESGIGFMIFSDEAFYYCGWIISIVFIIALFYGILILFQIITSKQ